MSESLLTITLKNQLSTMINHNYQQDNYDI